MTASYRRLTCGRARSRARVRALWGLSGWRGNERIANSIKIRKVLPEREREEAAVPEAIERLISRGPPAGSGIPFEAWRSWHRYGFIACPASKLRHTCSDHCCRMGADCRELDGPLRHTARLSAIGRQKYARATSQPFRRAAGVFATSTRATGARLKLCQAQAVGRFPAESYSLPIPSFPLQPLRPHNARTRARARATATNTV